MDNRAYSSEPFCHLKGDLANQMTPSPKDYLMKRLKFPYISIVLFDNVENKTKKHHLRQVPVCEQMAELIASSVTYPQMACEEQPNPMVLKE